MFAPEKMLEINLFVSEQDINPVTRTVARMGLLHLLDVSYLGERLPVEHSDRRDTIRAYAALDRRIQALIESITIAGPPAEGEVEATALRRQDQLREAVDEFEQQIRPTIERLATVEEEVEYLTPLIRQLALLSPLDIALEDLQTLDYLYLAAGSLPLANLDRLETSLFHLPHVILPFEEVDDHVAILAFASKNRSEVLDRALKSAYFVPFELPLQFSGPINDVLDELRASVDRFEREREKLHASLDRHWQECGRELLALRKRVHIEQLLAEATEHFGHTGHAYLIAGWIPARRWPHLLNEINRVTEGRVASEANRPEVLQRASRTVPSGLHNPRLLRPFEQVTTIYGVPSYHELDPTPILAITFVIMFGMMFGDVGHGFMIAGSGALIASGRLPQLRGWKAYGSILIACGLSSMMFGFLYGSVFGDETLLPALWLHPLQDILTLLIVSVAFGVVVLNIGFLFSLINAWRARDLGTLFFGPNGLAGFLLYWAILAAVLSFAGVISISHLPLLVIAAITLLAIALVEPFRRLLAGERPLLSDGLGSFLVQAFFELFETVIAFLSNTLSYVRLGAFAVAHIGLTLIVFILADLAGGIAPLRWLVIVLGTIAVVAFEGLIVGIQTLRLEYYEFFNKFFQGTGISYRPLDLPEA